MAHISLVTLGVEDLRRATRFYEALGWRRSAASVAGTVTFLEGGSVVLALYGRADLVADAGLTAPLPAPGPAPVALAVNVANPAEVDHELATAGRAGGTITRPAETADWGGYSGYFTDPDGHLWEVAYNPGFPLLADGRVLLPVEPGDDTEDDTVR